jgi:nuclear transport factor 2 (NTF2) superfamily protein
MSEPRPPLPPFSLETATQKVRLAEDAWNSRDPEKVALAYTEDSRWRNRAEIFSGRALIVRVPAKEMGTGTGLSADQGAVGVSREPDGGSVQVRIS